MRNIEELGTVDRQLLIGYLEIDGDADVRTMIWSPDLGGLGIGGYLRFIQQRHHHPFADAPQTIDWCGSGPMETSDYLYKLSELSGQDILHIVKVIAIWSELRRPSADEWRRLWNGA